MSISPCSLAKKNESAKNPLWEGSLEQVHLAKRIADIHAGINACSQVSKEKEEVDRSLKELRAKINGSVSVLEPIETNADISQKKHVSNWKDSLFGLIEGFTKKQTQLEKEINTIRRKEERLKKELTLLEGYWSTIASGPSTNHLETSSLSPSKETKRLLEEEKDKIKSALEKLRSQAPQGPVHKQRVYALSKRLEELETLILKN